LILIVIFLSILLAIWITFQTWVFVMVIIRSIQYARALKESVLNKLHCGSKYCPIPIADLDIPVIKNLKTYDKNVGRYCADLIARIYKVDSHNGKLIHNPIIEDPRGLSRLSTLTDGNTTTFGVVWQNNKTVWIAYRGTLNFEELMFDLEYGQNRITKDSIIHNTGGPLKGLFDMKNHRVGIHQGFIDAYKDVKHTLLKVLNKAKPDNVVICGHSLGAGVAVVTALDLIATGYKPVVYTFGSPRVGDIELCNLIPSQFAVFRHVNIADIIPTIPPASAPNFADPDKPYMYSHCGMPLYFESNWQSLDNNHTISHYIQAFETDSYQQLKNKSYI